MTPPSDHAELRRLAEAATQGPWTTEHGDLCLPRDRNSVLRHDEHPAHDGCSGTRTICESQDSLDSSGTNPNLEYIAAASPAVVLALLDEIERLEREGVNGVTVEVADVTNDAATLAECGHLRAEVERLKRAFGVRGLGRHSTGPSVATREGDSDAS